LISDCKSFLQLLEEAGQNGIVVDREIQQQMLSLHEKNLASATTGTVNPRAHHFLEKA
jgi:hypothetical protein